MSAPPFSAQLIGQTEKALNAILRQFLAATSLTERDWVTINVAAATGVCSSTELAKGAAGALKLPTQSVEETISNLLERGLLSHHRAGLELTNAGLRVLTDVRERVAEITPRLWGDLPQQDLHAAARVLSKVLKHAEEAVANLAAEQ